MIHGQILDETLVNWFTYHTPSNIQVPKYEAIRNAGLLMARCIVENCSPGPDTTTAVRKVREAVMTANASIACEIINI